MQVGGQQMPVQSGGWGNTWLPSAVRLLRLRFGCGACRPLARASHRLLRATSLHLQPSLACSHADNVHLHPLAPMLYGQPAELYWSMGGGAMCGRVCSHSCGADVRHGTSPLSPAALRPVPVPRPALPPGFSCHLCLPSGMSAPDGAALGTAGISAVSLFHHSLGT